VKSTSLDIPTPEVDNPNMKTEFKLPEVEEIIANWKQGVELETDGYEDLGRTLQMNALEKTLELPKKDRLLVVDRIFPVDKNGN
jgi:ABC-type protease/lipase transport system fused ATPase/permease subunit